jgi:hypothetical protein
LGLTGTDKRVPKVLRYVKLNHLCHDRLLDRVNLCANVSCIRRMIELTSLAPTSYIDCK